MPVIQWAQSVLGCRSQPNKLSTLNYLLASHTQFVLYLEIGKKIDQILLVVVTCQYLLVTRYSKLTY